jgi:hypothetical protein
LTPTGTYKKKQSWNFLGKFTELNYKLKYVAGQGVLSYVDWEVGKEEGGRGKGGGRAGGQGGEREGGGKDGWEGEHGHEGLRDEA